MLDDQQINHKICLKLQYILYTVNYYKVKNKHILASQLDHFT